MPTERKLPLLASAAVTLIACSTPGSSSSEAPATRDAARDVAVGDASALADGDRVACVERALEQHVTNARGLGNVALSEGYRVRCGQLLRGGELSGLTDQGCRAFEALGIKRVIDLRQQAVQTGAPPPACVGQLARLVSAAMPKLLPDTPENYLALLEERAAVAAVFSALDDPDSYPVYIHCVIGRDRASFVSALVLLALGASRQAIVDEFKRSESAGVAVKPPCIEALLDELERRGGIAAYLSSVGVQPAALEVLRTQARRR